MNALSRAHLVASHPVAEEAGRASLAAGHSALRAVVTGFFAAAAESSGVLLSPLVILGGGLGRSARAFDGRPRQPGLGQKRPRGFTADERIPAAAYAAVPTSLSALALACAHDGITLGPCVRPAVSSAKKLGAVGRARLLERVATLGASALADQSVSRALLADFGLVEGGLITQADLQPRGQLDAPARELGEYLTLPWQSEDWEADDALATSGVNEALGDEHVVVAADAQGAFVALGFFELAPRLMLGEFEVVVPAVARPIERGVPRVTPGTAVPSPRRVRLCRDAQSRIVSATAWAGQRAFELLRDPDSRRVTARKS